MKDLDYDIEAEAVEKQMRRFQEHDVVIQAMKLRCEQERHDWQNACSVSLHVYEVCRWCGSIREL